MKCFTILLTVNAWIATWFEKKYPQVIENSVTPYAIVVTNGLRQKYIKTKNDRKWRVCFKLCQCELRICKNHVQKTLIRFSINFNHWLWRTKFISFGTTFLETNCFQPLEKTYSILWSKIMAKVFILLAFCFRSKHYFTLV